MESGSIVHIDYDLYNADTEDLIETTRQHVAEEHDKAEPGAPILHLLPWLEMAA